MSSTALPPLSLHAWLRFDAIQRLIPPDTQTLLEIGAGQGSAGVLLTRRFDYVGLEPDDASFAVAKDRIGDLGRVFNLRAEAYEPSRPFDVVCAFEVLEHIEDEAAALTSWLRHVRPGGWLMLSVPAGRDRFGATDVKAGHVRRYDREDLAACLLHSGLAGIEILSYGFPLGYALEAVRNAYARRHIEDAELDQRTAASGRWLQPPDWSARLTQITSAPFRYLQRPFGSTNLGTGFVALARNP
jgi:SAM-dependent methyltransferase